MNSVTGQQEPADLNELRKEARKIQRQASTTLKKMEAIEAQYRQDVAALKYELSKEVIAEANAPINRATSVFTIVLTIVALFGAALAWITLSNLQSTLKSMMADRIESYLSLSDEGSVASQTLDAYRTRALLNAYMIQLVKERSQNQRMTGINFKPADRKRLLAIVQSKTSTREDFFDALRLLAAADGEWGLIGDGEGLGRELLGAFNDPDFDANRKLDILQVLQRDRSLMGIELAILANESAPEEYRYQSYLNLKGYSKENKAGKAALDYAVELLRTPSAGYKVSDALEHLSYVDPSNDSLASFDAKISTMAREQRLDYRLARVKGLLRLLPHPQAMPLLEHKADDLPDQRRVRQEIATLFSSLLADGLAMDVDNGFAGSARLGVSYATVSGARHWSPFPLYSLLEDPALVQTIFATQAVAGLEPFIRFFTTFDRSQVVTAPKFSVPAANFAEQTVGGPETVIGRIERTDGDHFQLIWRDALGDEQASKLESLEHITVQVQVDKDYLSYRDASLKEWIF